MGSLDGKRVHILGLAFRPEVKVDSFTPARPLRDVLLERGAIVTIEDPFYTDDELRQVGYEPARAGEDDLDAVILNTAHQAFADPDFARWRQTGIQAVVDGRNLWKPEAARTAGLIYLGVGTP